MRRTIVLGVGGAVLLIAWLWWRAGDHGSGDEPRGVAAVSTRDTFAAARAPRRVTSARLSGRVTRASDGRGVAGAVVSIAPRDRSMGPLRPREDAVRIVATDADGAWSTEHLVPGAYRVAATATGLVPQALPELALGADEDRRGVDLALAEGGARVSGTVTDIGGGPIAEARLTVRARDGGAAYVTTTNEDGRYELTLPPGTTWLAASHEEYCELERVVDLLREPMTVDFALVPGASIRGTVVDRASGEPVRGGLVYADDDGGAAPIGADGTFFLRRLAAAGATGAIELSARGPGFQTTHPTEVVFAIGEPVEGVKVLVDRGYSIAGRVVHRDARGVPGATVTAVAFEPSPAWATTLEPSADDGAFAIVGLGPGSYELRVDGAAPGTKVELTDHDVTGVVLEIGARVTLAGRVEPATPGVSVSLEASEVPDVYAATAPPIHGDTDATGAFVLRGVPAGSFVLVASADDGRTGEQPIVVTETDRTDLVVELEHRASISGRVVDTYGKAVPAIPISARALDGDTTLRLTSRRGDATSSSDGTFTVRGLSAGAYELSAAERGSTWRTRKEGEAARARVTVIAGEAKTGVVLAVEARDGVIRGRVQGDDGAPVRDVWVTAHREDDLPETDVALTDAEGRFAVTGLRAATYVVEASGPRGASYGVARDVSPGDDVTITVQTVGSFGGVVRADGAPLRDLRVVCAGPQQLSTHIAPDGAYSFTRVPGGTYTCGVESEAGSGRGVIDVAAPGARLDIAIMPWTSLTGVVVDAVTKQPIAGVFAFAGPDGRGYVRGFYRPKSDESGRFTVDRVAVGDGVVTLKARESGAPLGSRAYTAVAGQPVDVGTLEIAAPEDGRRH